MTYRYYQAVCFHLAVATVSFSYLTLCHAGIVAPTAHSRANCAGFNESITWHLGHSHPWRVMSFHYQDPTSPYVTHVINTGMSVTWRQAAYHPTEAYSSRGDRWLVVGMHFYQYNGQEFFDSSTRATDCDIYSGWWDY